MARYRVGTKLGRTIYRDDRLIGMMDDAGDARWMVDLLNSAADGELATPTPTEDHEAWLKRDQALHPATTAEGTGRDPYVDALVQIDRIVRNASSLGEGDTARVRNAAFAALFNRPAGGDDAVARS